jgi:hypothetical protein
MQLKGITLKSWHVHLDRWVAQLELPEDMMGISCMDVRVVNLQWVQHTTLTMEAAKCLLWEDLTSDKDCQQNKNLGHPMSNAATSLDRFVRHWSLAKYVVPHH